MQLNPGGTLNHKYSGETAVRSSGLPDSVIRSTGDPSNAILILPSFERCFTAFSARGRQLDNFSAQMQQRQPQPASRLVKIYYFDLIALA